MAQDRHRGSFIFGLLVGMISGAAATLLTTPKSGDQLRADLGRRANELQERLPVPPTNDGASVSERLGPVAGRMSGASQAAAGAGKSVVRKVSERVSPREEVDVVVPRSTTDDEPIEPEPSPEASKPPVTS